MRARVFLPYITMALQPVPGFIDSLGVLVSGAIRGCSI
jgi:hypothetical protein